MIKRLVFLVSLVLFLIIIPSNTEATMPVKEPARGWLGVHVQNLTPELARILSLKIKGGALVADVVNKSPAEKAGFKKNDVIVEFNGKPVLNVRDLVNMVANTQIGKTVSVRIIRKGSGIFLAVTIQQSPDISSEPPKTSVIPKEKIKPSEDIEIPDDLGEL